MENQHLTGRQVVVGKIHQSALLLAAPLLLAIPFHLLRMGLTILLPVAGLRLAPLARTLQAHLPVHRIGSDLVSVIILASSLLAGNASTDGLLGMTTGEFE